jgi:hypothetical protein
MAMAISRMFKVKLRYSNTTVPSQLTVALREMLYTDLIPLKIYFKIGILELGSLYKRQ